MTTPFTLTNPSDVKSVGEETLAYSIYESELDLTSLSVDVLRAIVRHIKPVREELANEYYTGDRDLYPPDWYDSYVFPLDSAISSCENQIEELTEESEEW